MEGSPTQQGYPTLSEACVDGIKMNHMTIFKAIILFTNEVELKPIGSG